MWWRLRWNRGLFAFLWGLPRDVCLSAHITGILCEAGWGSIELSHTLPRSAAECGLFLKKSGANGRRLRAISHSNHPNSLHTDKKRLRYSHGHEGK